MANLSNTIENSPGGLPLIQNGYNSNQPIKLGGTANVDTSSSSGTDVFGAITVTSLINTGATTGGKTNTIDQTTATVTLTAAQSGSVILIDKVDGVTITLPAPQIGLNFKFLYVVDQTSSNTIIITDAGTTFLKGGINMLVVNSATSKGFVGNGTTHVKVTSNDSTTGGLSGGSLEARCITATQWSIDGQLVGSGAPATPFST